MQRVTAIKVEAFKPALDPNVKFKLQSNRSGIRRFRTVFKAVSIQSRHRLKAVIIPLRHLVL